jgi:hypothetical protein
LGGVGPNDTAVSFLQLVHWEAIVVSKGGGRPSGGRSVENAKHTQGKRDMSVSMSTQRMAGAGRYDTARQHAQLEKAMEHGNIVGKLRVSKKQSKKK